MYMCTYQKKYYFEHVHIFHNVVLTSMQVLHVHVHVLELPKMLRILSKVRHIQTLLERSKVFFFKGCWWSPPIGSMNKAGTNIGQLLFLLNHALHHWRMCIGLYNSTICENTTFRNVSIRLKFVIYMYGVLFKCVFHEASNCSLDNITIRADFWQGMESVSYMYMLFRLTQWLKIISPECTLAGMAGMAWQAALRLYYCSYK